jgi:CO/xanthine dehydrogenase FAD-binding subunit
VKPPAFDYHAPASLDEAIAMLHDLGEDAKVIAGGQSLVPMMNFRLAWPPALVDLNGVGELDYLREEQGQLRVGALVRQRAIERSPLVRERCPLLLDAIRFVGHAATRTRGTVAGSIAHADPAAEMPTVLTALDGQVIVRGAGGSRVIAAEDLFLGHYSTTLEPGEVIVEVRFPVTGPRQGHAFEEFARRFGDFAIAGVAASIELTESGECREARIALCGAASRPVRARAAEQAFVDGGGSDAAVAAASALAAEAAEPQSDMHGDEEYRRELVGTLCGRALHRALARAREDRT